MAYIGLLLMLGLSYANAACPSGWTEYGTKCYHLSMETETWVGAELMCKQLHGLLVEIEDIPENNFLKTLTQPTGDSYWIGLTDVEEEGTFIWMNSGVHLDQTTSANWAVDQPDLKDVGEDCVAMDEADNYKWFTTACEDQFFYICERSNGDAIQVIG
ncbi:carbohydrate binding [Mactra antiquata]